MSDHCSAASEASISVFSVRDSELCGSLKHSLSVGTCFDIGGQVFRSLKTSRMWDPNRKEWICSVEASPVRISLSQASGKDSRGSDPVCSTSSCGSLPSSSPSGSSSRTFQGFSRLKRVETSESSSTRWPTSGFTTAPGAFWTPGSLEWPSDGGGSTSSLATVVEERVHLRFSLSQKAAAGILKRASNRNRKIPSSLYRALAAVAQTTTTPKPDGSSQPSQQLSFLDKENTE